jgi:[acyl-carrier-protein] S-malonyltransferase
MSDFAIMFPGVGSNYNNLGKSIFNDFKVAKQTIEEANDTLGINFIDLCFSPERSKNLNHLSTSQTALFTVCVALSRVFKNEIGQFGNFLLGHSLGEYSALFNADVMSFKTALNVIKQRGELLNSTASQIDGIMAWIINLDYKEVNNVCNDFQKQNKELYISAFDSPVQTSISGMRDYVMEAGKILEKKGAIVYPLRLSGPFHSPLMKDASVQFRDYLDQFTFSEIAIPVISNTDGEIYGNRDIKNILMEQLIKPIQWMNSIDLLIANNISIAIEIGPDKVLNHLTISNTQKIKTYSFEKTSDIDVLKKILKGI